MKHTKSDVYDGRCTPEQYAEQFISVVPVMGEVYRQESRSWCKAEYRIVFVDDKIAVGVEVKPMFPLAGQQLNYCLFYSSGLYAGWKYKDIARPEYRLRNKEQ